MSMTDALLQELDQEAQTTRRVLQRVPDDRLAWKPHDKSMSLGQLALHVATVPGAVAEIAAKSEIQVPGIHSAKRVQREGAHPRTRQERGTRRRRSSGV